MVINRYKHTNTIKTVFIMRNGMVAVCDENGVQIPKYQGYWEEYKDSILRDSTDNTIFELPSFNLSTSTISKQDFVKMLNKENGIGA